MKFREKSSAKITYDSKSFIKAFAQTEMVVTFMTGADPVYQELNERWLFEILINRYPEIMKDKVKHLTDEDKQVLKNIGTELFSQYQTEMKKFSRLRFIDPVLDVVEMLPKDELAMMAETLVSLTSFKRKVSLTSETVGGPIDVAVISKGDGLIWIKRKHYFKPELNAHFLANYYREDQNAKGEK